MKKALLFMTLVAALLMATSCQQSPKADLVVYGKIYTAEDSQIVEAFAVKDGKFVYVGDKAGAEAFVSEGETEVVDYSGQGLVMPGCGNAHAHYSNAYGLESSGTFVPLTTTPEQFMTEILPEAVEKARASGATTVSGYGWNLPIFRDKMPTRQDLDKICSDIPIYFVDNEGHKAIVNTLCLVNAGIMKADGTVLMKEVRGGEIEMGPDGTPTGYLKEQASPFVRSTLDTDKLYSVAMAKENLPRIQERLLAEGYTMYMDGYSSYFYNDNFYKAAQELDQEGNLQLVLGTAYEVASWMDIDEALQKAYNAKQYASTRVVTNWIKIFFDGTVESGTGFVEAPYPDGSHGIANWEEQELTDLTRKANDKGLTIHVHVMGNKGVRRVVNAIEKGGKKELRNTLVHVYDAYPEDYQRMADNNIYVTSGIIWHHDPNTPTGDLSPIGMEGRKYPMKSFFDHGIPTTIHSDYPANCGSPDDPFGIMEIAVTGVMAGEDGEPFWTEELVTREQALAAMTINCARQMFLEDERGSIKEGKYADFLLLTNDVLTCPVTEIHETKPAATYFEGKKVYSQK